MAESSRSVLAAGPMIGSKIKGPSGVAIVPLLKSKRDSPEAGRWQRTTDGYLVAWYLPAASDPYLFDADIYSAMRDFAED